MAHAAVKCRMSKFRRVPPTPAKPSSASAVPAASPEGVRVSKLMAERGLCSRREADSYIERGLVFVNGERITTLGTRAACERSRDGTSDGSGTDTAR